jgi:hypothetical protein
MPALRWAVKPKMNQKYKKWRKKAMAQVFKLVGIALERG